MVNYGELLVTYHRIYRINALLSSKKSPMVFRRCRGSDPHLIPQGGDLLQVVLKYMQNKHEQTLTKDTYMVMGQNPGTPGEPQNSW